MLRITCILNIVFKVAITFVFDTEGLFDLSETRSLQVDCTGYLSQMFANSRSCLIHRHRLPQPTA